METKFTTVNYVSHTRRKSNPMMNSSPKYFYLFKGDWYERFMDLIDMMNLDKQQKFFIWEPLDRKKGHNLLITSGTELPEGYCLSNQIWKTDEQVFDSFYRNKSDQYNIHTNAYES